jgi:hypothetical protein
MFLVRFFHPGLPVHGPLSRGQKNPKILHDCFLAIVHKDEPYGNRQTEKNGLNFKPAWITSP